MADVSALDAPARSRNGPATQFATAGSITSASGHHCGRSELTPAALLSLGRPEKACARWRVQTSHRSRAAAAPPSRARAVSRHAMSPRSPATEEPHPTTEFHRRATPRTDPRRLRRLRSPPRRSIRSCQQEAGEQGTGAAWRTVSSAPRRSGVAGPGPLAAHRAQPVNHELAPLRVGPRVDVELLTEHVDHAGSARPRVRWRGHDR